MSQFSVHRNGNPRTRKRYPYLIDIQNDFLEHLATRVVIPLRELRQLGGKPGEKLCPLVQINNT